MERREFHYGRGGFRRHMGWNKPQVVAREKYVPKASERHTTTAVTEQQERSTSFKEVTANMDGQHMDIHQGPGINNEDRRETMDNGFPYLQKIGEDSKHLNWGNAVRQNGANRDKHAGMALSYIPPVEVQGARGVKLERMDMEEEIGKWENGVVGYVMGFNPTMYQMKNYVGRMWRNMGEGQIYLLNSGVFVFVFETEERKMQVPEKGPWSFDSKPLILKPWSPDMSLAKEGITTIPIWIRIPGLNLHLWSVSMLSKIASVVGVPLFTDRVTANMERLAYARICVEVTAGEELPKTISLENDKGEVKEIKVVYEWVPFSCSHCKLFGHKDTMCKTKPKQQPAIYQEKEDLGIATDQEKEVLGTKEKLEEGEIIPNTQQASLSQEKEPLKEGTSRVPTDDQSNTEHGSKEEHSRRRDIRRNSHGCRSKSRGNNKGGRGS